MRARTILSVASAALLLAAVPARAGSPGSGLSGGCKYAQRSSGGGVTYEIAGVVTAAGTYQGIPFVAVRIRCRLFLGASVYTADSGFLPGPVAATHRSVVSGTVSGGRVCATAYGILRQTPPGEPDNLIETSEQCSLTQEVRTPAEKSFVTNSGL